MLNEYPESVAFLLSKGYPLKIKGNDGYIATLIGIQSLNDGDFSGIYRYPGGDCVHGLEEVKEKAICSDSISEVYQTNNK